MKKEKTRLSRARFFTTHYISVFFYHKHYLIDQNFRKTYIGEKYFTIRRRP